MLVRFAGSDLTEDVLGEGLACLCCASLWVVIIGHASDTE
jgi:hypothetical protein